MVSEIRKERGDGMSMLIIGVNPPKSCYACSWYNKVECPVSDGRYYYRVQRHPSCPLIELHPHSDLVDRNELLAEYDRQHEGEAGKARKIMEQAKAVIEAEGET